MKNNSLISPSYWINMDGELCDWRGEEKPAPMMRRKFFADSRHKSVILRFAAPGYAVVFINGVRVGDWVLAPTVTQFDRHVALIECDITGLVNPGENAVSVILGNGWFNCGTHEVWHFDKAAWRNYPRLFLEIFAGRKKLLGSDRHWKCAPGPIVFNQLRSGEHYDARREISQWNTVEFDDSQWRNAVVVNPPPGILYRDDAPQCRIMRRISPVGVRQLKPDIWIYDFGTNLSGFCEITVNGKTPGEVMLEYSENLDEAGDITRDDISGCLLDGELFQTDRYVSAGTSEPQTWHPEFTYHGFRYVRLTIRGQLRIESLTACFVHSNFRARSRFSCSDPMVSSLLKCTETSYLSNFTGIPTDCPHREKNGWTGDAMLACETGLWSFDAADNYRHFLQILADCQRPDGQLPGIAPSAGWGYNWGSGPVWDAALFVIPWQIWRFNGDISVGKEFYANMKSYLHYCLNRSEQMLLDFGLGDWCHPDRQRIAPVTLTSTAYFYHMLGIFKDFAEVLAPAEAEAVARVRSEVKEAFIARFRNPETGFYANDEVTANGCALYFGLDHRPELIAHLNRQVIDNDYHADFGIIGAKVVPRVLAENGYAPSAFRLLTQKEYPGWGCWIARGATSLWENWNGKQSQNHIMFGDFTAWCYEFLGGIRIVEKGFSKILLKPAYIPSLKGYELEYRTSRGTIRISYRNHSGDALYRCHIPDGIRYELELAKEMKSEIF